MPTFDRGFLEAQSFVVPLHSKFDDEDCILTQQPDQHDEANLAIDIICQSHLLQEQEGSEDPHWQRQDDCQRQNEAFVLPDQYQIDEDDDDQKDIDRQVSLTCFVIGKAFPTEAVTAR